MIPETELLKQVPIFSGLSQTDLEEIVAIADKKSYGKNEGIFFQGDPGSFLFILVSGSAKISLIGPSGKEAILKMLYPNDFFGEMSLLDGQFRSATIISLEKSEAIIISRKEFCGLIKKNPEFVLNILSIQNRNLRKATEKIASLSLFDAYGRVAQVLIDLTEQEGISEGDSIALKLNYSRQELAGMAGLARETFTRILHEFEERGYLTVSRKKILIEDKAFLTREII